MIDAHPDSLCLWLEYPRVFRRFQTKGFIQGKAVTRFLDLPLYFQTSVIT
ncbi:hypothetical protein EC2848050_1381 [Escherichia coli 2848050]|nr:hypothetical protein EC2848050_1381 [Escherichia coli 2848050]